MEVHERVFAWVLGRLAERGLVKGDRPLGSQGRRWWSARSGAGVDASTMEADAATRSIRRRDTGESYRAMLTRMAEESGIATPTAAELKQFDRECKGKRLSSVDWASPTDPEARITRLQDGRTRLAYKPEHAVDLDTEAIVAAAIQSADRGDTTTLDDTLEAAVRGLDAPGCAPTIRIPAELIADKGYHSRAVLKDLAGGRWQTRIAEPKPKEVQRRRGDLPARRAVYSNRAQLRSRVGKEALALRAEKVERSFALTLDRGGLRRGHAHGPVDAFWRLRGSRTEQVCGCRRDGRGYQSFRVRAGAEPLARPLHFAAQFALVVDLAVVYHPYSVLRRHRLMSRVALFHDA